MKKYITIVLFALAPFSHADAQVLEIIKLVTEKVIRAIDLKIQAMQNQTIKMQLVQQEAETALSKQNLGQIGKITEEQKELYRNYFASLMQVKQVVSSSALVIRILQQQKAIVVLYNEGVSRTKQDRRVTEKERNDFIAASTVLVDEGALQVNSLEQALRNNYLKATDAERMKLIQTCSVKLDAVSYRLQTLYNRIQQLSISRARDESEKVALRKLYGLN